jgi:hypothetical protein
VERQSGSAAEWEAGLATVDGWIVLGEVMHPQPFMSREGHTCTPDSEGDPEPPAICRASEVISFMNWFRWPAPPVRTGRTYPESAARQQVNGSKHPARRGDLSLADQGTEPTPTV